MHKKYEEMTVEERKTAATAHRDDFFKRLEEIGIAHLIETEHQSDLDSEEKEYWKLTVKSGLENSEQIAYTLIGLIAHFNNRKWISGWGYTYIMKTHQRVVFSGESD